MSYLFPTLLRNFQSGKERLRSNLVNSPFGSESSVVPWDESAWNDMLSTHSDLIQSLRDSGYGDLVDSILSQWKGTLSAYSPGLLDNIAGSFGARSGQNKHIEYVASQLGEALNGIAQQRQQNLYDSPLQQSARERQAGLNSDLLGIGDVAGAAAPAEDTNNVLPESQMLTLGDLGSIGQGVINAFSSALGFMQTIGNLRHTKLINKGLKIENTQGLLNTVRDGISKFIPHLKDLPDGKYDRESMTQQVLESLSQVYNPWLTDASGRRRRNRASSFSEAEWNQMRDMASNMLMSAPFEPEAFESWTKQLKSGSEFVQTDSSEFTDFDINGLYEVMKIIVPYQDRAKKLIAETEALKAQEGKDYQQFNTDFGGDTTAQYEKDLLGLNVDTATYENNIKRLENLRKEAENAVLEFVKSKADSGDPVWQWIYMGYALNLDMSNILGGSIGDLSPLLRLIF